MRGTEKANDSSNDNPLAPKNLAQYIDHTLLRPDAKELDIIKLCEEALEHSFKAVCIERQWLSLVSPLLKGSPVLPITVLSFPAGDASTGRKVEEALEALEDGAKELDMVLNRALLREGNYDLVLSDIASVVDAAGTLTVKVILETSELTHDEKVIACSLAKAAGAGFVKTSTGFSKNGATEDDVQLMRRIVGKSIGVKASGGIRSYDTAVNMIRAGANRLGTSASVAILKGASLAAGTY